MRKALIDLYSSLFAESKTPTIKLALSKLGSTSHHGFDTSKPITWDLFLQIAESVKKHQHSHLNDLRRELLFITQEIKTTEMKTNALQTSNIANRATKTIQEKLIRLSTLKKELSAQLDRWNSKKQSIQETINQQTSNIQK